VIFTKFKAVHKLLPTTISISLIVS